MASTDIISVDFGALDDASGALMAKAKDVSTAMTQLQASLAPIKETWYASGSSAGAAAEASETRLRGAIDEVVQVITTFSGKVTLAGDIARKTENDNANLFA
ncbi:WXG100 family type VII secretion target [Catenuloplanes japonicus]|uniref:WXG100 family type VII secretion target n=1 Tax=Catenuloplanes japonicus TaxID=33876 RepID=UPI0005248469|nr:WXG100 family type VII secretion target [Catenuloplanes japonicus]